MDVAVPVVTAALYHISSTDCSLLQAMARDAEDGKYSEFRVQATEAAIVVDVGWLWPWRPNGKHDHLNAIWRRLDEGFSREFCDIILAAAEKKCWLVKFEPTSDQNEEFTVFSGDEVTIRRTTNRLDEFLERWDVF